MKALRTLIAAATLATIGAAAHAAPNANSVYFQAPAIAGSGCPAGTSDFAITPDGQTLTILFDSYAVKGSQNKACNIAVPVHVPNGFQVSLMTADYRGWVQGSGELRRSYFFAGQTGPSLLTPMSSSSGKEYTQRDSLITSSNSYAKCGQDVNLRLNSRVVGKTSKTEMSLDGIDITNGVIFQVQYKPC